MKVVCGGTASLGKFAAHCPTFRILPGDKYHKQLRGSPAAVCRATSGQECFTSNGKCSQLVG